MFERLDESNFLLYAAHFYENPGCGDTDEFLEDLKRFKYIKKLVTRYRETGELKERLILNHIIVLCNMFGPQQLVRMIFVKMPEQMDCIKPFLVLLDILPRLVVGIGRECVTVDTDDVGMDQRIVEALRRI